MKTEAYKYLTNSCIQIKPKLNRYLNITITNDTTYAKAKAIDEVASDLADTEKEKFEKMAENVEYDSADKFKEKLETIKESYFPKTKIEETTSKDEVDSVAANAPTLESNTDAMAAYTAAITKNIKSVKV